MIRDDCSKIGYITKPHGKNGEVVVRLNGPFADDIEPGGAMFFEIQGTLVPFFIEEIRPSGDMAYVKFEFVDSEQEARKYRGCNLYSRVDGSGGQPLRLSGDAGLEGLYGRRREQRVLRSHRRRHRSSFKSPVPGQG